MQQKQKWTKGRLIAFEKNVASEFERGKIRFPIHLSGGNEGQLMKMFEKIDDDDWVFSTHRSHYHYLLHGGPEEKLMEMIRRGDSMHVFDKERHFFTSSVVAGITTIAAGVAWALKQKGSKQHVWCFIGDGAEDEGHTYEAIRFVDGHNLPCTFIIEDNDRSVATPKSERYGNSEMKWPKCVVRYSYTCTYPHVGVGKWVTF